MEETTLIPPSASADGKRNAFYHACKRTEQQRPYAACLKIVQDVEENNASELYSVCNAHIKACRCPALGMRDDEKLQGKAIYFIERQKVQMQGAGAGQKMRDFFESLKSKAKTVIDTFTPKERVREEDLLDTISTPTYADAITKMVAKASAGVSVKEAAVFEAPGSAKSRLHILPGETPAQAARRHRQSTITN